MNKGIVLAAILIFVLAAAAFCGGCTVAATAGANIAYTDAVDVVEGGDIHVGDDGIVTLSTQEPEEDERIDKTNIAIGVQDGVVLTVTPAPAIIPAPTVAIPTIEPVIEPTAEPMAEPTPSLPSYEVTDVDDVKAYVNAGTVNLRKGPGTEFDIICELSEYDTLKVTGKSGEWYKVKIDDEKGFVLKEFIEIGSVPTPTPEPTKKPETTPESTIEPTQSPQDGSSDSTINGSGEFSADELLTAAKVVYLEARGSGFEAYKAVANVLYNRVVSSSFPSTLNDVIYQKNQFSVVNDLGSVSSSDLENDIIRAVNDVFVSKDLLFSTDVLFFRTATKGTTWGNHQYYATYGANAFFK